MRNEFVTNRQTEAAGYQLRCLRLLGMLYLHYLTTVIPDSIRIVAVMAIKRYFFWQFDFRFDS